MNLPTVGLVSPGQMGSAVAGQARLSGAQVFWSPQGRSPRSRRRASEAGLTPLRDMAELCAKSDIILSICPPADAEEVARTVASQGFIGTYVEANAIDPMRFHRIEKTLEQAGSVMDACIIGPPPSVDKPTTLYVAGNSAAIEAVVRLFRGGSVHVIALNEDPPAASALKMAYAGYQKATRTLAAVAHALASRYDVTDHLLREAALNSKSPLSDPAYIPSVAARAWRWAPEMRDVGRTLRDAHLPAELAEATADILTLWFDEKDKFDLTIEEALEGLGSRGHSDYP